MLITGTGTTLVLASAYLYLSPNLPSVDVLRDVKLQTPLRIYSADRQLIGEFGEKRSIPIKYSQIPSQFINALLSAEDDDFYSHHGVSTKGLLRAASQLLLTGQKSSGGSTITMQVARNYFLSSERTFSRKFNEILLSLQIERELSKGQILELYANIIFLGHRAYGFEAAAHVYYGKSLNALSLPQLAMIAGLPKAPSRFNPLVNQRRALVRRNWILGRMRKLGHIDQDAYQEAVDTPISAAFHGTRLAIQTPYIAEMARREVLQRFGNSAYTAGYKVYTTVDSTLQQSAQAVVSKAVGAYDSRHGYRGPEQQLAHPEQRDSEDTAAQLTRRLAALRPLRPVWGLQAAVVTAVGAQTFSALLADGVEVEVEWDTGIKHLRPFISTNQRGPRPRLAAELVAIENVVRLQQTSAGHWQLSQLPKVQAALVSLDANSGAIRSLVGGYDYQHSKFNRITQATRQPGSNFKPFIYTAALANGYTAASIINDAAIVFEDDSLESAWRPTNDTGKFYGPTRLRYALTKSRNMVSIRLLRALGIRKAIDYVGRFGFDTSQLPRDLSLALGSHSVRPLQIVTAYAAIANGGYRVAPFLITQIDDIDGDSVYRANPDTVSSSLSGNDASLLTEEATIEDILLGDGPSPTPNRAERIIEPRVAYIIDSILKDVVNKGTGRKARVLKRSDIAGKTGTTNGPTDAWFSGYAGGIATTVWVGFDKNNLLGNNEFGSTSALPAWIDYMKEALDGVPQQVPSQPPGVISVKIDPDTGLLARPGQKNAIFEVFRQELAPNLATDNNGRGGNHQRADEPSVDDLF